MNLVPRNIIEQNANANYRHFLAEKAQIGTRDGFRPLWMPDFLFDFQVALTEWAIEKGRAAIFADCGLGKTPMQLVWAENVARHTNGSVLILTPLAVAPQTVREGEKFGIQCHRPIAWKPRPGINVINYEQLHHFDPNDFAGAVCDESSILKSFDGARKQEITQFMRKMKYRLLCTATAAPNDYFELGTSSEALGYLGHMDMLNHFFKNDLNNSATRAYGRQLKWRFKGHAEEPFWRWVCSWARAIRRPADLGFANEAFSLPPLRQCEHVVKAQTLPEGLLFSLPAVGLDEQREEQRRTIGERCEKVAALTNTKHPALVWCHFNDEGDLLERLIPGAVQVSGSDSDEAKEEKFLAFQSGQARILVTKPKIGAWGLNFQHCAHVTFFPSHSFEQFYQGIRRCWRFGQTRPVTVDVVTTEGGRDVLANLQRKADGADKMFSRLVAHMTGQLNIDPAIHFTQPEELPAWL